MNSERTTIIIPAYNEATVISDCLQSLNALDHNVYQVIVACNGCTDGTAELVTQNFPFAQVIEIEQKSKIAALRAGEQRAEGFPLLYLDADIVICAADINRLMTLARDSSGLVVPRPCMDFSGSSWLVRRFYNEWLNSDFVTRLGFGSGTFVLSSSARQRFDDWPDVINDDGFLRYLFSEDEICIADVYARVRAPKRIADLIKIKIRSRYGNRELQRLFGRPPHHLRYRPQTVAGSFAYYGVNLLTVVATIWQENITGFSGIAIADSRIHDHIPDDLSDRAGNCFLVAGFTACIYPSCTTSAANTGCCGYCARRRTASKHETLDTISGAVSMAAAGTVRYHAIRARRDRTASFIQGCDVQRNDPYPERRRPEIISQ